MKPNPSDDKISLQNAKYGLPQARRLKRLLQRKHIALLQSLKLFATRLQIQIKACRVPKIKACRQPKTELACRAPKSELAEYQKSKLAGYQKQSLLAEHQSQSLQSTKNQSLQGNKNRACRVPKAEFACRAPESELAEYGNHAGLLC